MTTHLDTIKATHFDYDRGSARADGDDQKDLKAEWTKLRTLPSTWRTVVMAVVISIGLGAILCVSQVQQWATMTAQQRLRSTRPPARCSASSWSAPCCSRHSPCGPSRPSTRRG